MERDQASKFFNDLLKLMLSRSGSDLFITAGFPPTFRRRSRWTASSSRSRRSRSTACTRSHWRAIMNDKQAPEFVALRELPGTDLGLAFLKGLSSNTPKDQVQKHVVSTKRLIEIFSGKPKRMPGETFAMEFVPGKGTQFFIQNQPQRAPVGDAEFFNMVLRIWVGPSPADIQLRDRLLGKSD